MLSLLEEFRKVPEFRKCAQKKFVVGEALFVSILSILAGADGYEEMEVWIKLRRREIAKLLKKPFIPPADNTIRGFFLGVDLTALENLLARWSQQIAASGGSALKVVAADGKTLNGSSNRALSQKAHHIVSLFLAQENLVLAQCETDEKSNEIPALLELLESLELKNCIITMDAMHTHPSEATIPQERGQKNTCQDYQKAA